jgi:ABC-type transport system involved in multi-copper enzyme maturation permease subunit
MAQIQPHNSIRNLWIISRFELVRLFQTPRGLMSIAAFAIIWYFILRYPILKASQFIAIPGFKESVGEVFGQVGLSNLLEWPVAEFAVFWLFALFLFPIFTLMITADQTSSDRSRGTMRFLTLRTSRDSIFFGRFFGQLIIQALLITGVLVATFIMAIWNNTSNWLPSLNSAITMGVNLMIVILPFTAMMAFFSASVRSSRLAIIIAIISWGVTLGLINYLSYKWPILDFLSYIIPGQQLPDLIQSNNWDTLKHSALPLIQTAALLLIGRTVIKRSSL